MDREALKTLREQLLDAVETIDRDLAEPPVQEGGGQAPAEPGVVPPMAWGAKVSDDFRAKVLWTVTDLDIGPAPGQPSPDWLMACMAFETGRKFTANVRNPASSATGLIQFMRATAIGLGTTVEALAQMTPERQIKFVWQYFRDRINERGPIRSLGDCYMAILNPVAIGKPDSYQMWVAGSQAYKVNRGLDANKDQVITKAEAAAKVYAMLAEGLRPENVK